MPPDWGRLMGMTKRPLRIYLPIIVAIIAAGLPARTVAHSLPGWYVNYAGDYWWAMLVFFLFTLVWPNKRTAWVFVLSLTFAYAIEVSQLFHPAWLDEIRSHKIFALILGHGFLWTDIVAYTLGISSGALIDQWCVRKTEHSPDA